MPQSTQRHVHSYLKDNEIFIVGSQFTDREKSEPFYSHEFTGDEFEDSDKPVARDLISYAMSDSCPLRRGDLAKFEIKFLLPKALSESEREKIWQKCNQICRRRRYAVDAKDVRTKKAVAVS